ncbi:hypothetical protein [Priestia flexa]|uniref:Uncharacterized protein n=1 Tax=Priestia flexa TaxID=86664 RepID=A0ABU4J079_9BACI|nr:hypothetical protein [Priestia flexa]MDW8514553.1 hypothetical protein [Priestia flexa]
MERRMNRKVHVRCEAGENGTRTGEAEGNITYRYPMQQHTF